MRRAVRSAQVALSASLLFTAACGGGGGTGGAQSPPPTPDFSIALSSDSVNVAQGATSAPVTITITGQNDFASSVSVSFTELPAGVMSNPTSPFSLTTGQSVSVLFGVGSNAATGQFTLTAQATSGGLSHSKNLTLSIQAAVLADLPQTAFVENNSVVAVDSPLGQPRRKHVVYDSTNQRFYVANGAMNRVEVFSATNPNLQLSIPAPGAASVDLSADGSTVWVGTSLEEILAIDTAALRVKARYPVSGITPIPGSTFIRPTEALALSTGKLLVRLRQPASGEALLSLWDPATDTFSDLTSVAPAVFQNGVGVLARSGDHRRVLAAANDASGELAVFDSNGNLVAGPAVPMSGTISAAAANPSGTAFAVAVGTGGATQVLLVDGSLNLLGNYSSLGPAGLVFSSDANALYVDEPYGNSSVVSVLSTTMMQSVGQIPDIPVQGVPTSIEELGASSNLVGLSNRGVAFLDVSKPTSLPLPAPVFASVPAAQPAEGPAIGGTSISLSGMNFGSTPQVRFGSGSPINANSSSGSQIQVATPANAAPGAVNVTAYFPNGWLVLAPSAFSYGPAVVAVLPNAGKSQGRDTVEVLGYGFGTSAGNVTVTIGGNAASVKNVQALPGLATTMGLDSTYPYALECITMVTPGGSPGKADLAIHSSAGSAIAAKAFQYVTSSQVYTNPGLHKFIAYDQSRQRLYLTATDHVDVFDLKAQAFVNAIEPPPNGPPPDAGLRGLALTPDASQLIVADFGAQSVYLINPDGAAYNGTAVSVGGVEGFPASGPARVAATNAQSVFVGLTGEGGTGACNNCLGQMNILASPPAYAPAPQPEVSSLTGTPLLQADAAGDLAFLAYDTSPGGPVALWNAATPNAFSLSTANDAATDLATAGDGTAFAMRTAASTEIRGANLALVSTPMAEELEAISNRVAVPGIALHPTGALTYEPFLDGAPPSAPPASGIHGGIDIRDAHSGQLRLRVYMPEPFAMLDTDIDGLHGGFLATDENGQRLFALTTSGLSIVQLANVPLGIGNLSPSSGPSAGGTSISIRGSGFVNGIKATLGGKSATVALKDMNTLVLATPALSAGWQQLVLTNPDGESVGLDAAFLAQ
jgi:IPT/TIG domain